MEHAETSETANHETANHETGESMTEPAQAETASPGATEAGWVVRPASRRDVPRVETLLRKNAPHLRGRLDPLAGCAQTPANGAVVVAERDEVIVAAAWACNRFAQMDEHAVPMWVLEALETRDELVADPAVLAGEVHDALVAAAAEAGIGVLIGVGDTSEAGEWDAYGYRRVPAGCSLLYTCDETGAVIPVSCDDAHALYVTIPGAVTPVLDAVTMLRDDLDGGGRIEVIPGGANVVRQIVEQVAAEADAS